MTTPSNAEWDTELEQQRQGKRITSTHKACPDCGGLYAHQTDDNAMPCRRSHLAVPRAPEGTYDIGSRAYLQFGPPWYEWPDPKGDPDAAT